MRYCIALAGLFIAMFVAAQESTNPAAPDGEPLLLVSEEAYDYPGTYKSLESIDWQNFSIALFDADGGVLESLHLHKGRLKQHSESGSRSVGLGFASLIDSPATYAVLYYWEANCGGSCSDR